MDRILRKNLTQINNVGLGNQFTCDLPLLGAYRYIDIVVTMTSASGKTLSGITDFLDLINIKVNGKDFRAFLAKEANQLYTKYGSEFAALIGKTSGSDPNIIWATSGSAPAVAGANEQDTCIFRIYFEEPWRKTWAAASSRKFYTIWPNDKQGNQQILSSFQLQAIIPSTTNNAGATGLSVQVFAGYDASKGPVDPNTGVAITNSLKWYRFPGFTYTAAGDQSIQNVVKYNKGVVLAVLEEMDIFSQSSSDLVNRVQVNVDGKVTYDVHQAENTRELEGHLFNEDWDQKLFQIVPDANDVVTDGLVLSTPNGQYVNNLVVTATLGAASGSNKTLVVISQVYGPLD